MTEPKPQDAAPGVWDGLLLDLRAMRLRAGNPSFSVIARRIMENRMAVGADEHQARVATSTVHYAFRLGRARVNLDFTREVVEALGGDPSSVDDWVDRGVKVENSLQAPESEPGEAVAASLRHVWLFMLVCVALNLAGREFVDFFRLPIYLDMAGTAIAAIALGPWRGAAVGLTTNVVGIIGSGWISLPFALVNVIGALVWGYGVRHGMGRSLPRFFALNAVAAFCCSLVAVPIIATLLQHDLRVGNDVITQLISDTVKHFPAALTFSNLLTSLGDKLVSGFFALVVISALPLALRGTTPLVTVSPVD